MYRDRQCRSSFVCSECGRVIKWHELQEHDFTVHPQSATDRCVRAQVDPKPEYQLIASLMFDNEDHVSN